MALLDKTNRTLLGIGIGAGAVVVIPYARPLLAAIARPLMKAIINQSMLAFEKAAETLAGAAESFQDLVAEARVAREQRELPIRDAPRAPRREPGAGAN